MKRLFTILAIALLTVSMFAQSPQLMSYQAVVRNSSNVLVINQVVGMRISILQGSATGTAVYVETQAPTTNANGLASLQIGGGVPVIGTFPAINWASGSYYIKTETDPTGGSNYTIISTNQMLSVPYALYAANAGSLVNNHYLGEEYLGGIILYLYIGSDGQQHGFVVSKTESDGTWAPTNMISTPSGWATTTGATSLYDGAFNTNLLPSDSPLKLSATAMGSGWYVPSIEELNILVNNKFHLHNTKASGVTPIVYNLLSSTELTYDKFYSTSGVIDKRTNGKIRCIRSF